MHYSLPQTWALLTVALSLVLPNTAFSAKEERFNQEHHDSGVMRVVVKTSRGFSWGTGFLINRQGYVVTNYHVIRRGIANPSVSLFVLDGGISSSYRKSYRIIWSSNTKDLAILKVSGLSRSRVPLTLAEAEKKVIRKGQLIWTSGFPGASDFGSMSMEPVRKDGFASAYKRLPFRSRSHIVRILEHNATSNKGNSGGPVSDKCGRVVAITSAGSRKGTGTFWAIRVAELIDELKRLGILYRIDRTGCIPRGSVVITRTKVIDKTITVIKETGAPMWMIVAMGIGLLMTIGAIGYLWYRRPRAVEGMTQYLRQEVSRLVRRKTGGKAKAAASSQHSTVKVGKVHAFLHGSQRINGVAVPVTEESVVLGRSSDADYTLSIEEVGRQHARVGWDPELKQCWIEDLDSMNGTWKDNGERLSANTKTYLNNGDSFYLGIPEVAFRVLIEES